MPLKIIKKIFSWLVEVPEQQTVSGTEIAKASTDNFIPKIYGTVKNHQGTIIFKETTESNADDIPNELLHIIVVWSEAVTSIDKVYLDDVDAESDSALFVKGSNRYAHVRNFPNGMGSYSDDLLTQAGWRATDTVDGKACSYIRLQYANGENLLRREPKIRADITGTPYDNPALCLKDYLQSNVYGKGLQLSQIDLTALSAVESYCDTLVETYAGSGVNRKLFTCNIALDTSKTVYDNTNRILKSFRGLMPIIDGKYKPIVEKDDPVVPIEVTELDIRRIDSVTNSSKSNRYNRVVVEYYDADDNGTPQEAVFPEKDSVTETNWLAEDNGIVLEKKIKLETCNNFYEALNYAKTFALISREQLRTEITLDIWGSIYEVGDIIEVSHSQQLGWDKKLFRVDSTTQFSDSVELSIREHQPAIYANDNNTIKPVIPDTSNTLSLPASPTGLTVVYVYNSKKQFDLTWDGVTSRYDVTVKDSQNVVVDSQVVSQKKYTGRNFEFGTYTVEVRSVNSLNMRSLVASTTFVIDQERNDFTWIVYAEDANGLNASLTDDSNKTHIGIKSGQDVALTNINQITGVNFGYFDKPSGGTAGANGKSIYTVNVYRRSASQPSKPADNSASYNFTTDVLTPPSGWSASIPTGTDPIWVTTTTFSVTGSTGIDSTCTFTNVSKLAEDGENGVNGTSYREISIYRRSAVALGAPSGGSYDFSTDTLSAPTNWSFTPPEGNDPLYISRGVASVSGNSGIDNSINWSTPTLFVKDGVNAPIPIVTDNGDGTYTIDNQAGDVITFSDGYTPQLGVDYFDGVSGEYVSLIFRNAQNKPSTPTGGTFDGTTETFPSGWTDTPQDFSLPNKRWVSTRRYQHNPRTNQWSAVGAWSEPSLQAEIGEKGESAVTSYIDYQGNTTSWIRNKDNTLLPIGTTSFVTVRFRRDVGQVASRQIRADVRNDNTIDLVVNSFSGEATNITFVNNGTKNPYAIVTHTNSNVQQTVQYNLFVEGLDGQDGTNGTNGTNGQDGVDGLTAYEIWLAEGNSGTQQDFLNSLKGADGQDGQNGTNGQDGQDGLSAYEIWLSQGNSGTAEDFIQSLNGSDGVDGNRWFSLASNPTSGLGNVDDFALVAGRYVWRKTSSTVWTYLEDLKGADGTNGTNGTDGQDGVDGLSAYEIWLAQGNSGTQQDFINSLKGADGQDGQNGTNGQDGADGLSAYEIWLSQGNSGTAEDFVQSLNGSDGVDGNRWYSLASNPTSGLGNVDDFALVTGRFVWRKTSPTVWSYIEDLKGADGQDGQNGANGQDGQDGADGKDGITADAIISVKNQRWGFAGSAHGWQPRSGTDLTVNSSSIILDVVSNGDTGIFLDNLGSVPNSQPINGSKYFAIRVRIRTLSNSHNTNVEFYYRTANHSFSGSYVKSINVDYVQNEWTYLVLDMRELNQGGSDWIDSTITGLRLDFANQNSLGKQYEIDGIVVGEFASGEMNPTGQAINLLSGFYQNPLPNVPFTSINNLNPSIVSTDLSHNPPSGGNHFRLVVNNTTNDASVLFAESLVKYNIRIPKNKKFIVSFYAKRVSGATGRIQVYLRVKDGSIGAYIAGSYKVSVSSTEWQRYFTTVDVTSRPNSDLAQLRLDNDGDLNSAIHIDNIMIEVLEDEQNPIPSPYVAPFNERPVFEFRRNLMNLSAGVGSALASNPLSAADVGSTARISIAAHTLQLPNGSVSYNSGSVSGLSFNTRYYVYVDDPYYQGGSVTYQVATAAQITNISAVIGRRYLGSITTPSDGQPPTTPPEDDCPHIDMWLTDTLKVSDVKIGDVIDGVQFGIWQKSKVTGVKDAFEDCVKITTESGCSTIVSVSTPIERKDQSSYLAINACGEMIQVENNGSLEWERVTNVEFMANQPVKHISLDNISFLSGIDKNKRVVTHNTTIKP